MDKWDKIIGNIDLLVQSGFYEKDEIALNIVEIFGIKSEDEEQVLQSIDSITARKREDEKSWPEVTDCDRLDRAFAELNRHGILSLQNAGCDQQDGFDVISGLYSELGGIQSRAIGFCFYDEQDLQRAVKGDGLFLAFGSTAREVTDEKEVAIGNIIKETLAAAGLAVTWDGTAGSRPMVMEFKWQRRGTLPTGEVLRDRLIAKVREGNEEGLGEFRGFLESPQGGAGTPAQDTRD